MITGSCLIGTVSAQSAAADVQPGDIYVAAGDSGCSDSGPGTFDAPFCTIGAAAAAAGPGQTVHVYPGSYNETVHLTRSGNPGAPITFVADRVDGRGVDVGDFGSRITGDAFDISGAQHVVVRGFWARPSTGSAFRVDGAAQDVTIDQAYVEGSLQQSAVLVTGGSTGVVVSRSAVTGRNASIRFDSGSNGTIASNTVDNVTRGTTPMVDLVDAPGTAVVGNTLLGHCEGGISLTDGSTGSTIENNIVITAVSTGVKVGLPLALTACATPTQVPAAIALAGDSTAQSHLDYNLLDTLGGTAYAWGGTPFASATDLTTATGQGVHELSGDPQIVEHTAGASFWLTPQAGSPAVDSADAGAPGETPTDQIGDPRADDPNATDTGTGPVAWYDRGATELVGGTHTPMQNYRVYPDPANGPLAVRVTFNRPTSSWTTNGPLPTATAVYFANGSLPVVSGDTQLTYVYKRAGAYDLSLSWSGGTVGLGPVMVGADYTPNAPQRLLDTRHAIGVAGSTPVPAGGNVVLHLPTIHGIDPSDISAIAANVTVTQPTANGVLTVYPDGNSLPTASNLNFAKGQTVPNMVTVAPGADGAVRIHNSSAGTVHVVLDLAGIYANTGSAFKPTSPVRVLDTRGTLGGAAGHPLKPGIPFSLDLSKALPASATAAVLNVTATQPAGNGFLTVFPTGSTLPNASNLNYTRGQTVANQVIAQVVNGKITLQATGATVHAIVDVSGWFGSTSAGATDVYLPYGPTRILDTRNNTGVYNRNPGALAPRESIEFNPSSPSCVPVCPLPDAFVLNVTATAPTATGFLTVYPATLPTGSTLNFTPGTTVPNQATVQEGGGGARVYNGSPGTVQVVADESGFYFIQKPFYG